jgi:hypothetical protein
MTMEISESELAALTRDLDEIHHDALPRTNEAVSEWGERLRSGLSSRRMFLGGMGAVVAAGALAACSKSSSSSTTATTVAPGSGLTGDLAVAALATALENTAVATYQAALNAVTAGKLSVPPAVATFATTAQSQHKDHAAAWNAVLTQAGKTAIPSNYGDTTVFSGVVLPAFNKVTDVVGLANLALLLENVAAATYLAGISAVTSTGAIQIAASIQPVEMQHAAILNFVLGNYPVPDSFAKTDGARTGSDQIGVLA